MTLPLAFGAVMRRYRREKQMSFMELSNRSGLHHNYLGSVERGERNLSLANIWRIAAGLEVTVAQLLDGLPPACAAAKPELVKKAKPKKAPPLRLVYDADSAG
ncbi:helix-turn-helix domain-containing protein [Variovorax ginsengisoli]|uniref:Helix-turn-helix transcriptional regulator n=1 Tax=Variovorax ginsengisoli TaxID=363844 RepID=A0ABT8SCC3_9BURK|nr:helix-turn-helix transcriptional regulator [Variovorax ginsengisoli]MDN8617313.1 helix-turn-helix transcriptional regulator [Variovorax ginsengisoli]MDO1536483.1 helix-turn-helix transcriptional regulator [Variovorax ginsengisoli]